MIRNFALAFNIVRIKVSGLTILVILMSISAFPNQHNFPDEHFTNKFNFDLERLNESIKQMQQTGNYQALFNGKNVWVPNVTVSTERFPNSIYQRFQELNRLVFGRLDVL